MAILELGRYPNVERRPHFQSRNDAGRIAPLVRHIGTALDAIHSLGIFHRDLQPENLMIRSTGPANQSLVLIDVPIAIVRGALHLSHNAMHLISPALEYDPANRPRSAAAFTSAIAADLEP